MLISENKMTETISHRENVIEGILDLIVSEYTDHYAEGRLSVLFIEKLLEDTKLRLKDTPYKR